MSASSQDCACKKFFADPIVARIDFKCDGGDECCEDEPEQKHETQQDHLPGETK